MVFGPSLLTSSAPTNCCSSKLDGDLVGNAVELTLPLTAGFVEQLSLGTTRVVETFDSQPQQANGQMARGEFAEQFRTRLQKFLSDVGRFGKRH